MRWITDLLRLLATALTFMTRLPVSRWSYAEPTELGRASAAFPLVGALVALLCILVWWIALQLFTPALAAGFALLTGILVTGAFHEDGLADTADGLGGAFNVQRKLEIMRDSRVGTYGAVALVMVLGMKWLALANLPISMVPAALLLGHVLGRWSTLPLAWGLPYVQLGSSQSKPVAEGVRSRHLGWGSLWMVLLIVPAGLPTAALAATVTLAVTALSAGLFKRQLGGVTGDCLGAANQACELAVYLALLALAQGLAS